MIGHVSESRVLSQWWAQLRPQRPLLWLGPWVVMSLIRSSTLRL